MTQLSPIIAPTHLRGRLHKHSPEALRAERMAWAVARGAEGYTVPVIAAACGISQPSMARIMADGGYRWWDHSRQRDNANALKAAARGEA